MITVKEKIDNELAELETWLTANTRGNEKEFIEKARRRNVLLSNRATEKRRKHDYEQRHRSQSTYIMSHPMPLKVVL